MTLHKVLWMALICLAVGCHHSSAIEDEHEHFPPHWPESIFQAAERLHQVASDSMPNPISAEVSLEREMCDLIRWLPQLIADSDFSKNEFDLVDAWSNQYLPLLEKLTRDGKPLSEMLQQSGLKDRIFELRELCRKESERIQLAESN